MLAGSSVGMSKGVCLHSVHELLNDLRSMQVVDLRTRVRARVRVRGFRFARARWLEGSIIGISASPTACPLRGMGVPVLEMTALERRSF